MHARLGKQEVFSLSLSEIQDEAKHKPTKIAIQWKHVFAMLNNWAHFANSKANSSEIENEITSKEKTGHSLKRKWRRRMRIQPAEPTFEKKCLFILSRH